MSRYPERCGNRHIKLCCAFALFSLFGVDEDLLLLTAKYVCKKVSMHVRPRLYEYHVVTQLKGERHLICIWCMATI